MEGKATQCSVIWCRMDFQSDGGMMSSIKYEIHVVVSRRVFPCSMYECAYNTHMHDEWDESKRKANKREEQYYEKIKEA